MHTSIEQFRKELGEIALYADDTVSNYISCLYQFADFLMSTFNRTLEKTTPKHLRNWMAHLKQTGVSNSRLTHHRSALKQFFAFQTLVLIIRMTITSERKNNMTPVKSVSKQHFFQHVDDFIEYRTTIYETSHQTNRSNLVDLTLFKDFLDMKQYDYIDGHAVMDFQYYLKKQRLNCGASMNRKLFTLRSYTNYLKLEQIPNVHNLPFSDVLKCRQGYKTKPIALSDEQTKALLGSINRTTYMDLRDYAVYSMMYLLGLRVGEVHSLNLDDIDFDAKHLTVTGKGNKIRSIPLQKEIRTILAHWLVVRKHFLNHHLSKALFLSKKGNRLAIRTMEDNLQKMIKQSKLQFKIHVTCHTLRHTFASYLNEKGVDVLVIQNLLGHSSPKTTSNYYIHPSLQKVREALEKLPGVLYLKELEKNGLLIFQAAYKQRK